MNLIERDDPLLRLRGLLEEVARTGGSFVVLSGEAGIGKSALVREFCGRVSAPVHFGACDPLSTPRPPRTLAGNRRRRDGGTGHPALVGIRPITSLQRRALC